MFSFEGDFKTRPKVSLGGASKKVRADFLQGRWGEINQQQTRDNMSAVLYKKYYNLSHIWALPKNY